MLISLVCIDYIIFWIFVLSENSAYFVFVAVLIFAPTIGLLDTMRKMVMTRSGAIYNKHMGVIQIMTNFLRFVYWGYKPYKVYLLGQSIAVFGFHFLAAGLAFLFTEHRSGVMGPVDRYRASFEGRPLWNLFYLFAAKSYVDYLLGLVLYFAIIGILFELVTFLIGRELSLTCVIVISNLIDTTTSIPHFIQIIWYGECRQVSFLVVGQYLSGDLLKMLLFVVGKSGWPFILGASVQTLLDTILLISWVWQVYFDRGFSHSREEENRLIEKPSGR
jgi:hypothetical protein